MIQLGVARDFFGGDADIDRLAEAALAMIKKLGAELIDVRLEPEFLNFYVRDAGANIRRPSDDGFREHWEAYLATLGPNVPKTVAEFVRIYETQVAKSPLPVHPSSRSGDAGRLQLRRLPKHRRAHGFRGTRAADDHVVLGATL